MFGLFKKKEKLIPVSDCIWMSVTAKWNACLEQYRKKNTTVFVAWFEASRKQLEDHFSAQGITTSVRMADFVQGTQGDNPVIFIEHFPLRTEEQVKFLDLGLEKAMVYSSLDEPLFRTFGGEKIIQLMQKMGIEESEMITHNMVSTSIVKAQEKIAEKIQVAVTARSQEDWLANAGIGNI